MSQAPVVMPPQAVLMQLITGKCATQAVAVAAWLRLPDVLAAGPRAAADLARQVDAQPDALERLCRALCLFGVLAEPEPGRFELTPVGQALRSDAPGSMAGMAKFFGEGFHHEIWAELLSTVKTGRPAFLEKHPEGFAWLGSHPREAAIFDDAMTSLSKMETGPVCEAYEMGAVRRVCDVGGGRGYLLAGILRASPDARGVLYEMPHVVAGARELFAREGVAERAEIVAGDFFREVPSGFDHYVLKHVLHDWDDDACAGILERCAKGLTDGGRVLVIEQLLQDRGASFTNVIDIEMLLMTPGGRERTAAQFGALFERAGLKLDRVVPTKSPAVILQASRR